MNSGNYKSYGEGRNWLAVDINSFEANNQNLENSPEMENLDSNPEMENLDRFTGIADQTFQRLIYLFNCRLSMSAKS